MIKKIVALCVIMIALLSCSKPIKKEQNNIANLELKDWKLELERTINLYGHRNWIVIADRAYPKQSNPAIKTITIDANQLEAVEFVSQFVKKAKHVNANIFLDKEMAFVSEKDAKGIEVYKKELHKILKGQSTKTLLHEDIIKELDESAKLFNVLLVKTNLVIPYTSVFFQLECGYWNLEAENRLRKALVTNN